MKNIITIVTPSFNQAEYLEQAILSVWQQAGNFKIEHIIADGGSRDNSVNVISRLEARLKKGQLELKNKGVSLKWWSRPDNGQADALNQAFMSAKGSIFGWLNSDDYYEPGALQKVMTYFREHESISFMYGDMNFVDQRGKLIKTADYIIDFNFWRLQNSCYICQPSAFFRREVFKQVGLLNTRYHYVFDHEYWLRISQQDVGIQRASLGVLSNLRKHASSKTVSGLVAQRIETIKMLWNLRLFFNYNYLVSLVIIIRTLGQRLLTR